MPVSDQEPRYRLVDSNGNVVGSLFQNADGNVEIQDETGTGSVFGPNGIVTPAIDAGSASVDDLNNIVFAESGVKSINEALSEAGAGGVVVVKSGSYDEEVTMGENEQTLIGYNAGTESVRVNPLGSGANALTVTGSGCTIRNMRFDSEGDDVTIDAGQVSFFNNEFHGDPNGNRLMVISGGSTYSRVIGNYANTSDITLESGSEENVVIGNTRVGTITDNGTGNEVANNS